MSTTIGDNERDVRRWLRRRRTGPDAVSVLPGAPELPSPPDAPPTVHLTATETTPAPRRVLRPAGGARLPGPGQYVDLTTPPGDEEDDTDQDEPDETRPDSDDQGQLPPAKRRRWFGGAVKKIDIAEAGMPVLDDTPPTETVRRSRVWARARYAHGDRRVRVIAFNSVAAGVGYGLGLVPTLGAYLPAAEQASTGMLGAVLAGAGAYGAWKLTGHAAVQVVLPHPLLRLGAVLVAAELGRRAGPLAVDWLAEHGAAWGLGPAPVSLLLTAGAMCGGLYWLIDRRARAWHWMARLVVRIPLASALLATALYAPGTIH
ncbi:hypothetical protein ABZ820_12700 [Streptomyces diacarni]|uniref:hypothetical protein n=1 Tax=Streptomyces diacarni TaxID=2800381 RepID=UPI0033EBB2CE